MDNLLLTQAKLKAFAQLPQPEYQGMAKAIIEDINKELNERGEWMEHYKIEMSAKFMETIMKIADSGQSRTYPLCDYEYEVSVKKTKIKK